eukprot:NODE_281_length_10828_cov_0.749837.p8 type:complete len:120 gc:universal NODE_281_length_10828_cov_0.749837:502-143(-)
MTSVIDAASVSVKDSILATPNQDSESAFSDGGILALIISILIVVPLVIFLFFRYRQRTHKTMEAKEMQPQPGFPGYSQSSSLSMERGDAPSVMEEYSDPAMPKPEPQSYDAPEMQTNTS